MRTKAGIESIGSRACTFAVEQSEWSGVGEWSVSDQIGYERVAPVDQELEPQLHALKAAGAARVVTDDRSARPAA